MTTWHERWEQDAQKQLEHAMERIKRLEEREGGLRISIDYWEYKAMSLEDGLAQARRWAIAWKRAAQMYRAMAIGSANYPYVYWRVRDAWIKWRKKKP